MLKLKEGGDPQKALNLGNIVAGVLMIVASWFLINGYCQKAGTFKIHYINGQIRLKEIYILQLEYLLLQLLELFPGTNDGMITEYYTGSGKGTCN
ncbi:MAG: hypothetical protein MZV64_72010 [Ignavibacteriales bacterium]|nr:hypothetical protein [Ignavibacteriales bacterium]